MANRNIVVIGGSAGASNTVRALLGKLPADFPAAIFVTLHMEPTTTYSFAPRLATETTLRVAKSFDTQPIQNGHIYTARADHHLIVKPGLVKMSRGPRENLWRPAIDVLFRSAAVAYGSRVIGVLLSGQLDDGTAGLQAIKRCGGLAVVQDPTDALYQDMPRSAAINVEIDYCVPAERLPELLLRLTQEAALATPEIPQSLINEALIAEGEHGLTDLVDDPGELTDLSCPECGGPLWRRGEDMLQFRCLVGHAYHSRALVDGIDNELDRTLWAAIRLFEQRANISRTMEHQERMQGRGKRAEIYSSNAKEAQRHAGMLRELQARMRLAVEPQEERTGAQPPGTSRTA